MNFISRFLKTDLIPRGVKILTFVTAIRWIGWGFAESLLPVFFFSFTQNYATASLLRSSYDIAFILSLPVAGLIADRIRASSLVIFGLFLYILIGSSYFLAGITGMVLCAIVARFLNGVAFSFDILGRDTYTRRVTPQKYLAMVFGYVDTVAHFWWVVAAAVGIFFVKYIPIHVLLFLIAPTSVIAMLMVMQFRNYIEGDLKIQKQETVKNTYFVVFKEVGTWHWNLRLLTMFNFFIAFSSSVVGFFLPIESYTQDGNLSKAMLIGILLTVPTLFGSYLGRWFDKKGVALFPWGFFCFGILLSLLAFSDSYGIKLCVTFGVGIIVELLSIGSNDLITVCCSPEHYGRVGGVMRSMYNIGSLVGPLVIGIFIDWQGIHTPYLFMAVLMISLAFLFFMTTKTVQTIFSTNTERYHDKIHQR